jgi:hypothetical protein
MIGVSLYQPKLKTIVDKALVIVALDHTKNRFHGIADVDISAACVYDLRGKPRALYQIDDRQYIRYLILEPGRRNGNLGEAVYFPFSAEGEVFHFPLSPAFRADVAFREVMGIARRAFATDEAVSFDNPPPG